jgi:hypothetical protein
MIASYKIPPRYSNILSSKKYDPIFITRDPSCLRYIQIQRGFCLFCDQNIPAQKFDLSVCYQCEVWVLYSEDSYEKRSLELGRNLQYSGAKKVLIVPFAITKDSGEE